MERLKELDRLTELLSELAAEHRRLLRECEALRPDAQAWRAQRATGRLKSEGERGDQDEKPDPTGSKESGEIVTVDGGADRASESEASPEDSHPALQVQPSPGVSDALRTVDFGARATTPAQEMRRASTSRSVSHSRGAPEARSLKLWPLWMPDSDEGGESDMTIKIMISTYHAVASTRSNVRESDTGATSLWSKGCLQSLVVGPNSTYRVTWDVLSVAVLSYDTLSIPMQAFADAGAEEPEAKKMLDFITTVFWTCDIAASFLSGYHNGGVVEMRPAKIALRYVRGWFLLDFPVVLVDWTVTLLQSGGFREVVGVSRVSKVLRISRILRLFRLLRMLKLPGWAEGLSGYLRSEVLVTSMGVMRSLLIIAIASHFIACAWYFIGGQHRPMTWVQALDDENRDLAYRYTTALHWSVTQFTPASMEISPMNTIERAFTIVVILSAMVAFSCFISSITQAMGNLQRSSMEQHLQNSNMRRYISENQISLELGHRITRFIKTHNVMGKRRIHEEDVHIFKLLPESLRQELHLEVYGPVITTHPLFKRSVVIDQSFMHELCNGSMSEKSLGRCEEMFHPGQEANEVYFTRSGSWEYTRRRRTRESLYSRVSSLSSLTDIEGGACDQVDFKGERTLCEVALWFQWEHQGFLRASTPCEAIALNSGKFRKIAQPKPCMYVAFREYANRYMKWMIDESDSISYAPELGFKMDDLQEIVQEALDNAEEFYSSEVFTQTVVSKSFSMRSTSTGSQRSPRPRSPMPPMARVSSITGVRKALSMRSNRPDTTGKSRRERPVSRLHSR